jgi:dihydroorotate dehydrogenase electron transfer subunit
LKQFSADIVSNKPIIRYSSSGISVTYQLIRIEAPYIASVSRPGQFVTIKCGQDFILRRPLSIHRLENQEQISILFAVMGRGTQWLSKRQEGETLDFLGPLGNGFTIQQASKKLLLVAGGIGIAPLIFAAQTLLREGRSVKLLLGARQKDALYPQELLPAGIETVITTDSGSAGKRGMVSEFLSDYIDWADQIFACGPLSMYQSIAKQSKQWQSPRPVQVSLEVRLGCGVGACFGCSIKTTKGMKRVCRDGPVFNLDEVTLEEVRI